MDKHTLSLSEEELIRALGLPGEAGEGIAIVELMEATGHRLHPNTVRRLLSDLVRKGTVEFAGWRNIPDVTGRPFPRPVYRLKREEVSDLVEEIVES